MNEYWVSGFMICYLIGVASCFIGQCFSEYWREQADVSPGPFVAAIFVSLLWPFTILIVCRDWWDKQ